MYCGHLGINTAENFWETTQKRALQTTPKHQKQQQLVFINNILLEYSHTPLLGAIYGCVCTATAEWSTCNRDYIAYKA